MEIEKKWILDLSPRNIGVYLGNMRLSPERHPSRCLQHKKIGVQMTVELLRPVTSASWPPMRASHAWCPWDILGQRKSTGKIWRWGATKVGYTSEIIELWMAPEFGGYPLKNCGLRPSTLYANQVQCIPPMAPLPNDIPGDVQWLGTPVWSPLVVRFHRLDRHPLRQILGRSLVSWVGIQK